MSPVSTDLTNLFPRMQDLVDQPEVHVERFSNLHGAFAKGCRLIYDLRHLPHQILGVLTTDYDILLFASHRAVTRGDDQLRLIFRWSMQCEPTDF
jgi:hypothetical protein